MTKDNDEIRGDEQSASSKSDMMTVSKYHVFQSKGFLFASFVTSIFLVTLTNVINNDLARTNSNIFFIVLPVILSVLSARLLIKFPSDRTTILGFVLFSTLSAIAETLFIVYESVLKVNPFPSIADGFWLTGYLSLFVFFVLYLRPLGKFIPKKIIILSSLISSGFLIPSVIQAYLLNANSDTLSIAVALAYPVLDALILCPVIIGMTVLYKKRSDPFLLAMLIAILSFIVADSIYLAIYNSYENGNPIDIGWIIGYILFSYATVSYKSTSKNRHVSLTVDLENKKIVSTVSLETITRFVIPLVVIVLIMIGSIFFVDYYFKEKAKGIEEDLLPIYMFYGIFSSLLVIIFIINRNLMKLVKLRTKELENERDLLKQQNEEKTQLIYKSKLLESKLQESIEELKKTEQSKGEFIAMVTHELRTPLVPIKGFIDLLLAGHLGSLNDKQKERLEIIQSSSESLLRLVGELLDVQKLELGQLKLEKRKNILSEIIKSAIENVASPCLHKGIVITTKLEENVFCNCDKYRIEQVLSNLLLNSIDFVPKENGKIDIKMHVHNGETEIMIKDNGVGIEKDQLERIFVKFYQIDTSITREHGGTGLGLSICKGIIETHKGKIWVESEGLGKGAEFHILLPL